MMMSSSVFQVATVTTECHIECQAPLQLTLNDEWLMRYSNMHTVIVNPLIDADLAAGR
jgi:protein tyrosine phosphatase